MLRKGAFTAKHFDDDPAMSFKLYEEDPVSRQIVRFPIPYPPAASQSTAFLSFTPYEEDPALRQVVSCTKYRVLKTARPSSLPSVAPLVHLLDPAQVGSKGAQSTTHLLCHQPCAVQCALHPVPDSAV